MENRAAWIPEVGKTLEVRAAEMPKPGEGELVIENKAVALQPADYKIQLGILPFPLTYPTILGMSVAGLVHEVGAGVTRFKKGDRVISISAFVLRNDHRYGAQQRYTLSSQALTSHIGSRPFENAIALTSAYAPMSALVLHLKIDRPFLPDSAKKDETVLIWGGSSSVGAYAIQIAAASGYTVITTASAHNREYLLSIGASEVIDRHSATALEALKLHGPYKAVYSAADSAADQFVMADVLLAQGGGSFLATMGVRQGVVLPPGVTGWFTQYLDDYLKPENREFTEWFFWDFLEREQALKPTPTEVLGGLDKVQEGLDRLHKGDISGKKLVVRPDLN